MSRVLEVTEAIALVWPVTPLTDEVSHCSRPSEVHEVGSDNPSAILWRQSLLTLNHEVYHFQDVPLRKHVLDTFFKSLLILSDFLSPIRESFQFHLH